MSIACWTERHHWRWTQWLLSHRSALAFAISFNYDLVLERALNAAGVEFGEVGLGESGLPMLKPHSSVDFGCGLPMHPTSWVYMSDFPQRRLSEKEMHEARAECNLILPGEPTHLRQHQTVAPGFHRFSLIAPELSHLVIAGVSYWSVDRPEIDEFLDRLRPDTQVIVANPNPPSDLLAAIRQRGLQPREWIGAPEPI